MSRVRETARAFGFAGTVFRRRPATSSTAPATAIGLQRRMRALAWMGWEVADIAAYSGIYGPAESCRLVETYDELCMTFGPSDQARGYALEHGWNPPLAWDEPDELGSPHNIDDPNAYPAAAYAPLRKGHRSLPGDWFDHAAVQRYLDGSPARALTSAERRSFGETMLERGATLGQVQAALGVHWNVVKRLGLVDLAREMRAAS